MLTGSYSPLYASPQQMRGDKPDPRDDVYALGVIWYQLFEGDLASPAPTGRQWMEVLRSRGMSDAAIELLSSCFESEPTYRPADAGMLAEQLHALTTSARATAAIREIEQTGEETALGRTPRIRDPFRVQVAGNSSRSSRAGVGPTGVAGSATATRRSGKNVALADARRNTGCARIHHDRGASETGRRGKRWACLAAGVLGLFGLLAAIFYFATDQGTVQITVNDPRMQVLIDGKEMRVDDLNQPITVRTGQHKLLAMRDGREVKTDVFHVRARREKTADSGCSARGPTRKHPPQRQNRITSF